VLVDAFVALAPELDEQWAADAQAEGPSIGVLTFDPSPAGGAALTAAVSPSESRTS
jgi:hypothetical protein